MRITAASMFGSKNGSLKDLRRGRRNDWTSSTEAKPFRDKRRAIQSQPQICFHEIGPPLSSSGGRRIHRLSRVNALPWPAPIGFSSTGLGTDYFICRNFYD